MAGLRGSAAHDRRLQRDGAAAGADGEQGDEDASLAAYAGHHRPRVRRGERELHAPQHPAGPTTQIQGGDRGTFQTASDVRPHFETVYVHFSMCFCASATTPSQRRLSFIYHEDRFHNTFTSALAHLAENIAWRSNLCVGRGSPLH